MFDSYELVMFTRHTLDLDAAKDEATPFGRAHETIRSVLNHVAPYSAEATLNPRDTCEFPKDIEDAAGKCLIFDAYPGEPASEARFGLMAIIEVFPSEMEFARKRGGALLLERLKKAGHYPYSDMDRKPVA